MEWVALIAFAVSLVASYYLKPKIATPLAPEAESQKYPRCEEGALIPVVFGTVQINRPQLLWISQLPTTPVQDGGGGSSIGAGGSTIGYAYSAAMTLGLCRGKIDMMTGLVIDGRNIDGMNFINREDTTYPIKKHFESISRRDRGYGYIYQGYCTFGDEGPGVGPTGLSGVPYLINPSTGVRDGAAPGLFGIAVMEFDSIYLGQSPYPQTVSARVQRINYSLDGYSPQWYPEKAEIKIGNGWADTWSYYLAPAADATTYENPLVSVATWATGAGAVGSTLMPAWYPVVQSSVAEPATGDKLWLRVDIGPVEVPVMGIHIWHTSRLSGDLINVWWNGSSVTLLPISDTESYIYVESVVNRSGANVVAVRITCNASSHIAYAAVSVSARDAAIDATRAAGWSANNMVAMNPAHIIREVLLDSLDGMGYLAADVDDTAFTAVADTLYNERFGLCLQWEKSVSAGEFIEEILRYINGRIYINRETGKFTLRLVRQDYNVGDLLVLDDDNTVAVDELSRRATGDLVNAIRVEYTNSLAGDQGTVTVHDPALIQTQGQLYSTTVKYPGITEFGLASRVALRDLQIASKPLWVCKVTANREAADLYMGDPVILNKPTLGIDEMVTRVTAIDIGNGIDNRVVLSLIEDAFTSPTYSTVSRGNERWTNPGTEPPPASTVLVYDASYHELRRDLGETAADALLAPSYNTGHVKVASVQPTGALNASLYSRKGADPYSLVGTMDFCPSAQLASEVLISATTISYVNDINFGSVGIGGLILIGTIATGVREVVRVDAIDLGLKVITVGRGCLDTVPVAHPVTGTVLLYIGAFAATDTAPRLITDTVNVKVCPRNSRGEAPIAEATEFTLDLDAAYSVGDRDLRRAHRNYPPTFFRVNATQFLETLPATGNLVFTWNRRSKNDPYVRDYLTGSYTGTGAVWDADLKIYDDRGDCIRWGAISPSTVETLTYTNAEEIADRNDLGHIDASFASVSCLLHMDGPNGYKTIHDHGPLALTFSPLGTAEISTAQSKFGGASFKPGTLGATTWTVAPFQFGSGDFTVEAWIYLPAEVSARSIIASHKVGDTGTGAVSWMFTLSNTRELQFWWSTSGSGFAAYVFQASSAVPLNTWTHVAFVRAGTVGTLWVNGTFTGPGGVLWQTGGAGQPASITGTLYAASAPMCVGIDGNATRPFPGYIDELRITKGVARGPFYTLPTQQHMQGSVGLSTSLRVVLGSVDQPGETDINSTYSHNWTMYRHGYGAGYGKSYGGTP